MKIEDAATAGQLAEKIAARRAKIDIINKAMADGWLVNNIRALSPDGNEVSLILDTLDLATSKQALGFALQIYQAQLDGYQKQLDAL